jgi:hypothetical protein
MDKQVVFDLPQSLDNAKISGLPPVAFYIPDFITAAEEQTILNRVR